METGKIALFSTCHICGVPRLRGADTDAEAAEKLSDTVCDDCKKNASARVDLR